MTADRARSTCPIVLMPLASPSTGRRVFFERGELAAILTVYGRMVMTGEWRDYAIEGRENQAIFAVFRHAGETPLYRIEKHPSLASRQGAWVVIGRAAVVLRRGHELAKVLRVFDRHGPRLIS